MSMKITDKFVGSLEEFANSVDLDNTVLRYWFGEDEEAWYGYIKHIITLPDGDVLLGIMGAEDTDDEFPAYIEYYRLSKIPTLAYSARDND